MNPYQHKVQYYETDQMSVVHHSNYIRWMEEARVDFFTQIGCDYKRMEAEGIISPVIAVDAKYKLSTYFCDIIQISVWVEEFKGIKLKLGYEMTRDNTVVFEGHSEHCFLDPKGSIINLRREHPDLYDKLAAMIRK